MAVLLDTGILYAYYDRSDSWHDRSWRLMRRERGGLVIPAPVIPEVDHLLAHRIGMRACMAFYEGLTSASYWVADLPRGAYDRVAEINRQFPDLSLGFVDAAIVAIGENLSLHRIATTDRRDFEPLAKAFSLSLVP